MFNPDSLFWRLISRCVDIVGLSLLWAALSLPIITCGPASAALYYTVVKCFRQGDRDTFHTYWDSFKENLKQGLLLSLIAAVLLLFLGYGYSIMSFPSETGKSQLAGGIWGFGVFDNKDAGRTAAAKKFITWMSNSEHTADAVKTASYFPVRDAVQGTDLTKIYADNQTMNDYSVLMQYLGDYYQVTKNWANARTAWWNMLQEIGTGADIKTTVEKYNTQANTAS